MPARSYPSGSYDRGRAAKAPAGHRHSDDWYAGYKFAMTFPLLTVPDVVPVRTYARARRVRRLLQWFRLKKRCRAEVFDYGRHLTIKQECIDKFKETTVKGSQFKQPLLSSPAHAQAVVRHRTLN